FFMGYNSVDIPSKTKLTTTDDFIYSQFEQCYQEYVFFWSYHRSFKPCPSLCSVAAVVDGHQKFRRRICKKKDINIKTNEFDEITVGCSHTPLFRSQYCEQHQPGDTQISSSVTSVVAQYETNSRGPDQESDDNSSSDDEQMDMDDARRNDKDNSQLASILTTRNSVTRARKPYKKEKYSFHAPTSCRTLKQRPST
ncbi:unnamed protein product, partial [Didymodactylos carnosus]